MDPLTISSTSDAPGVNFDKEIGKFLIFGKSFPEEVRICFDPIIYWLQEYANNPNEETKFEIRLEYFNTSTSTMLLELLYILETIILEKKKKVIIIWHYLEEDDDMLEVGKEYSELVKIPFEFNTIADY